MRIALPSKSIAIYLASAAFTLAAQAQAPYFLPTVTTVAGNHIQGYTGDGGPAVAAELSANIAGSTMDPAGNIYIADSKNNVIRRVTPAGVISTYAGNGTAAYSGENVPATQTGFNAPGAVRYYQGALYVTDFGNGRIRRIDLKTGLITTVAGGGTTALNNASDAKNNLATSITIPQPQDVAFDNLGNMYWSQGGGTSRVDVVNFTTGIAHLFAGTGGTANGTGTNIGVATTTLTQPENTVMNGPLGVVVDAQNNVYIVETATHVIRKVTVGTTPVMSTYAGIGTSGAITNCAAATDSLGDGCNATNATLGVGSHMSIDGAGNIYFADSGDNRIRMIAANPSNPSVGGIVTTIAGNGTATSSADGSYPLNTAFSAPWDAQITPTGDIMIADRGFGALRSLHLPGAFGTSTIGTPVVQTVNVLTQAATGTFALPNGGDFTVVSAGCSAAVNMTGNVCTATVTFTPTLVGNRFGTLTFTDSNGTATVGVSGTGIGPVASLLPGLTSTAAGTGTIGATGDGAAATAATLQKPGQTAVDARGNVYIADTANNEIRRFTPGGTISRFAGTGTKGNSGDGGLATAATLSGPAGVAVDAAGNVYIADTGNNKVRMVDATSGKISTVVGTGTAGYTGDAYTPAAATLNAPTQLAWSPSGMLYIADTGNSAIRAVSFGQQLIVTAAGSSNAGFEGDGGPGLNAQLQNPLGVAVDANNNVYIADTGNNRIRLLSEGIINTIAGQTGAGYVGDGAAATTELSAPAGLATDTAGNVYIADTGNNRIRLLANGAATAPTITTVMGATSAGSTGDGGTSALALLSSPTGITLDAGGNVYIGDTGNNKVREIAVNVNSLAFKTLNPSESSAAQTVSVYDSGNSPLTLGSVLVPPGYMEQASTSGTDCTTGLVVSSGGSCNLNTVFNPPTVGTYNSVISVADNTEGVATAAQAIQVTGSSAYIFTPTLTVPTAATAGVAVTASLTVNNPIKTYTGTVKFTSTDAQALLPANYTFVTTDAGMKSFSVTFKTAGPQCLTITDTSDPTVTSTSCTTVKAATAAKIAVFSGNNQTANVSTQYAQRLVALVTDAFGNTVSSAPVVFTINPNGAATATFSSGSLTSSVTSDVSGYATSAAVIPAATVGTFTVTATLTGTSSTAGFTLNIAVLGSFTIVPVNNSFGPMPPGNTGSIALNIVPANGFNATINMACKVPNAGTYCTVSPYTVTMTNGVVSNQPTINFTTQGGLSGGSLGSGWWVGLTALLVAGLYRRRHRVAAVALSVAALCVLTAMTGCGQSYAPVTPNGSYVVSITGTAQTVSASTSVTFVVQK